MSEYIDYDGYYDSVKRDFQEMREQYPFSRDCLFPTVSPSLVEIDVIAASSELIKSMNAKEADFIGKYSRKLKVVIPFNYKIAGCDVYGGAWLDIKKIKLSEQHFYPNKKKNGMPLLCVGVPESFSDLKNVLLENVRTADEMLTAYELYLVGQTDKLILKAFSHGDNGKKQYKFEQERYRLRK